MKSLKNNTTNDTEIKLSIRREEVNYHFLNIGNRLASTIPSLQLFKEITSPSF